MPLVGFIASAIEASSVGSRGALAPPLRMPGLAGRGNGAIRGAIVSGEAAERKHAKPRIVKNKSGPGFARAAASTLWNFVF
jgi:hypothetical protein